MTWLSAAKHELRQLGVVTVYFLFCFGMVLTLKKLILAQYDIEFYALSVLVVSALVAAQVVLILDKTRVGARFGADRRPALAALYKTLFYTERGTKVRWHVPSARDDASPAQEDRMWIRSVLMFLVMAVALPLVGCAGRTAPATSSEAQPKGPAPSWLVGTWQGNGYQVAASKTQGDVDFTVTFVADGTWTSSNGYTGKSSLLEGDRILLEGADRGGDRISYTLKDRDRAGDRELWGLVQARFGTAMVSMKRVP